MRDRTLNLLVVLSAVALAGSALGCGGEDPDPIMRPDTHAPDFEDHNGQQPNMGEEYPPGPYGISENSTLPNYCFVGAIDPPAYWERRPSEWPKDERICLSDFYNPTGDGLYPEGSRWGAGRPKPKALLIVLSAVWCSVCKAEARDELPDRYTHYAPLGGEFLTDLAQDASGDPAVIKDLANWATNYEAEYPMVIDPPNRLGASMVQRGWPNNFIVDPRTMKIVDGIAGAPTSTTFWMKYQMVLNGEWQPPTE